MSAVSLAICQCAKTAGDSDDGHCLRSIGSSLPLQVLEAGASAVALVRSPKTSHGLQELHTTYGDALTIVAMDVGVFSSIQVRAQPYGNPYACVACANHANARQS
jgi:hypothetical protein